MMTNDLLNVDAATGGDCERGRVKTSQKDIQNKIFLTQADFLRSLSNRKKSNRRKKNLYKLHAHINN